MKYSLPAGIAFVVLLPLLAVHKLMYSQENVAKEFVEKPLIKVERIADFMSAMTEAHALDEKRENELNEIVETLPALNFKAIMNTLNSGVTTDETCAVCGKLVRAARVGLRSFNLRELWKIAKIGCSTFASGMVEPNVCRGLLNAYLDTLHQIGQIIFASNRTSDTNHCALIFGPHCGELTDPLHVWEVAVPPKRRQLPKLPPSGIMKILHLSDFHYDPYYTEGSLADCGNPLCCREAPEENTEEAINASRLAGRFGDHRHCDMPLESIESLLDDAVKIGNKDISHIYLTGDIPPHDVWQSNKEEYYNITKKIYALLDESFAVRVFPVIGNHEAVPPNLFSTEPGTTPSQRNTPELYANLAEFWSPWLSDEQRTTIEHGGYYSISVSPTLKVIALNTNFCYYLNFWLMVDSRDPAGQLKWLVSELLESEVLGQKVHLLGHVPPGTFDCIYSWSTQFLRIVQRFNSTITGQFYGHTHYDEFKVFFASDRVTPIGTAFIAPSATAYSSVNPAYKMFTYNEKGLLLDAITRTFNLSKANIEGRIDWQTEYEAQLAYDVLDLSPASMEKVSRNIATDQSTFDTFYRFYHRDSPSEKWTNCTTDCRTSAACSTRTGVHHDNSTCLLEVDTTL